MERAPRALLLVRPAAQLGRYVATGLLFSQQMSIFRRKKKVSAVDLGIFVAMQTWPQELAIDPRLFGLYPTPDTPRAVFVLHTVLAYRAFSELLDESTRKAAQWSAWHSQIWFLNGGQLSDNALTDWRDLPNMRAFAHLQEALPGLYGVARASNPANAQRADHVQQQCGSPSFLGDVLSRGLLSLHPSPKSHDTSLVFSLYRAFPEGVSLTTQQGPAWFTLETRIKEWMRTYIKGYDPIVPDL